MRYRVDNVPRGLWPFFYLYGYTVGIPFYLALVLLRSVCRVQHQRKDRLQPGQNYVFCLWHHQWFCYFITHLRHTKHVWINHPAWYMKPIHVVLRLTGVERLVLGSTGYSGKGAADQLVDYLRRGYSTTLSPDGPVGPRGTLHKGVLHIARQAGVAIVPLQFDAPRRWVFRRSWDKKGLPLPFSSITVIYGEPISVTEMNFDTCEERLTSALGAVPD
jgi:lysophospholipid acyltransferase (LPLAT)-like uncharacterized protein